MNHVQSCYRALRCYSTRTPFQVLSVKESATNAEIKQKYKELAKQLHPDRTTGNLSQFQELTQAYELLMNPHKKAYYMRTGQSSSAPPTPPPSYHTSTYSQPRYASNATFMSVLAGVIITIATFNLFYFHSSHTALLSAADQHHLKSSQDLKRARTEAQLFGNDRGIKRVIDNRMKTFRKE